MRDSQHQFFPVMQQAFRVRFRPFQFSPVTLALGDVVDDQDNEKDHQHASYDGDPGYGLSKLMCRDLLLFQPGDRVFDLFFFKVSQDSFQSFRDILPALDNDLFPPGKLCINFLFLLLLLAP